MWGELNSIKWESGLWSWVRTEKGNVSVFFPQRTFSLGWSSNSKDGSVSILLERTGFTSLEQESSHLPIPLDLKYSPKDPSKTALTSEFFKQTTLLGQRWTKAPINSPW